VGEESERERFPTGLDPLRNFGLPCNDFRTSRTNSGEGQGTAGLIRALARGLESDAYRFLPARSRVAGCLWSALRKTPQPDSVKLALQAAEASRIAGRTPKIYGHRPMRF